MAQSEQRAWLIPEEWRKPVWQKFQPRPDQASLTSLPIRNIGRVPAFNVRLKARASLNEGAGSATLVLPEVLIKVRMVYERNRLGHCALWITAGSQGQIKSISAGKQTLRVRVEMTYSDPLGSTGRTKFTMTYQPGPSHRSPVDQVMVFSEDGFFTITGTFDSGDSVME